MKGFRTSGGPNELFNGLAYFLSEVLSSHPAPTSCTAPGLGSSSPPWKGKAIDWGQIIVRSLLKEIRACQTRKCPARALLHWLGLLFRQENSRAGIPSSGPSPPPAGHVWSTPGRPQAKATQASRRLHHGLAEPSRFCGFENHPVLYLRNPSHHYPMDRLHYSPLSTPHHCHLLAKTHRHKRPQHAPPPPHPTSQC